MSITPLLKTPPETFAVSLPTAAARPRLMVLPARLKTYSPVIVDMENPVVFCAAINPVPLLILSNSIIFPPAEMPLGALAVRVKRKVAIP